MIRAEREAEWAAAADYVEARLKELRAKSWTELQHLPEFSRLPTPASLARFTLALHRHVRSEGSLRIVVQARRRLFLGLRSVRAEGFVAHSDGRIEPLSKEELWEYE